METKKITLRSQTVQCPHCGEYYSVTYKYCPFCDAGRQEEERKLAEKKKKKQAFLGNLFGSHEPEKKKKQAKNRARGASTAGERPSGDREQGTCHAQRADRESACTQGLWAEGACGEGAHAQKGTGPPAWRPEENQ